MVVISNDFISPYQKTSFITLPTESGLVSENHSTPLMFYLISMFSRPPSSGLHGVLKQKQIHTIALRTLRLLWISFFGMFGLAFSIMLEKKNSLQLSSFVCSVSKS